MNPAADDQGWLRRIGVTTAKPDRGPQSSDEPDAAPDDKDLGASHYSDLEHENDYAAGDVVDLDRPSGEPPPANSEEPRSLRRFTPWVAVAFGAAAVLATTVTVGAGVLTSRDPRPAQPPPHNSAAARPPAPVPPTSSTPTTTDAPIPFTASADCPPGSTAAQSIADPQARTPWICARSVDGQVLTIDLGRAYVITAVSIVPGAVNKTGSDDQGDPWLQHRVASRVQWQFNDTDKTIKAQNTGKVHGEAVMPVPNLLASAITVIIQETSHPPMVAPTTTAAPGREDSILAPLLGAPPSPDQQSPQLPGQSQPSDPSDGTFAVSSVKIIGHKAI
ncbi:MAG: hypothetical protein ACRDTK_00755 [Mycobacterium sp.]